MSEYQYYEFQTIDRRLTDAEMKYVDSLSSHIEVSPTKAVVSYSYGDFKYDPAEVLKKCFDAFLYVANWGSKRVMFRFPKSAVDAAIIKSYCTTDEVIFSETTDYVIVDFNFGEGSPPASGWIEGDDYLSSFISVRDDIMRGDYRAMYLGWLASIQVDREYEIEEDVYGAEREEIEDDEEYDEEDFEAIVGVSLDSNEPPVPSNLRTLSTPLKNFVDFLDISPDLLVSAAEASTAAAVTSQPVEQWIRTLPDAEKVRFLVQVANGEPAVGRVLMQRLRELYGSKTNLETDIKKRRTVGDLLMAAQKERNKRRDKEKTAAKKKTAKKMAELSKQESEMWEKVSALIAQKQVKAYDEAVTVLKELKELAGYEGRTDDFDARIGAIRAKYPKLPGLQSRLEWAKLLTK